MAHADSCGIARPTPVHLQPKSLVEPYRSVLQICAGPGGAQRVAIRQMQLNGETALLLADPQTLTTQLQSATCWTCRDVDESALKSTRMMRAIDTSAQAPELTKRGFLQTPA